MKILATGDLHYGSRKKGDISTEEIAEKVCSSDAQIFIIAGDTGKGLDNINKCLELFNNFRGKKLIVAGNHDIWTDDDSSYKLYSETLKEIFDSHGFHYLDSRPFISENTGFIGNIGWYDYSFRFEELNIPLEYYEAKYMPKVAGWNDRKYIKWNYDDPSFLNFLINKMKNHIEEIQNRVDIIISITHHLPFKTMLRKTNRLLWDFAQAYLGSTKIGELYLKYDKIQYAICGHSHRDMFIEEGHVTCINIGSTYKQKKLITLEI